MRAQAAPGRGDLGRDPEAEREQQPESAADDRAQRDLLGHEQRRARARAQQAREHVLVALERQHRGAQQQRHEGERDAQAVALHLRPEQVGAAARRALHEAHRVRRRGERLVGETERGGGLAREGRDRVELLARGAVRPAAPPRPAAMRVRVASRPSTS